MTTFANLKIAVSRDLRDPSNVTFTAADVGDLINAGLAEVGRIAPQRFQEDLTLVADAMSYTLLSSIFGLAVPEIEVVSVELWDITKTPSAPVRHIDPADNAHADTGWRVWDGVLQLPRSVPVSVKGSEANYKLRVLGYAPYKPLTVDGTDSGLSNEREWALRAYCRIEALQRLSLERDLFSQWQTRSGNTDVGPAALMNALSLAQAEWNRRARQIAVLRESS